MTRLLLALLATGCVGDVAAQSDPLCEPVSSSAVEARIAAELDASPLEHVALRLERADGRVFVATTGSPPERYTSSSTSKPVMAAVILDAVARRTLTLHTRVVDVLPGWSAATGEHRRIELRHLLSMTSGITAGSTLCWQRPTWAEHLACVDALPALNNDAVIPGERFSYHTHHLDIAGAMLVAAEGHASYQAAFDAWRARTGLFAGATWSYALGGASPLNVTLEEYAAFWRAIDACTILTPRLCAAMTSDQTPLSCGRNTLGDPCLPLRNTATWPIWGEDWHFGFALWMECASVDYDCAPPDHVVALGAAGQYAVIDREHGYRLVISPGCGTTAHASCGPNAIRTGVDFARSIDALLREWAAIGGHL